MPYILNGQVLADDDPRAIAARQRAPGGSSTGGHSMAGDQRRGGGAARQQAGAAPVGQGGARRLPPWLQPGTTLGDANAKLLESCPPQISQVAPPIVVVGVVGAFFLGGPQIAVIVGLAYFFSSQPDRTGRQQLRPQ